MISPATYERIRSGLAVTGITILIWLVADQNVMDEQVVSLPVRVTSDSPDRYAAFAEPPFELTMHVTFRGRRRHLKEMVEIVESRQYFEAVMDGSMESSMQKQTLGSREILNRIKVVAESGLKVSNIEPINAAVFIDEYETVPDVRVTPSYGELKVSAEPSPDKVAVKLPRFAAEKLRRDPVARADAQQRILAAKQADGTFRVRVPLVIEALRDLDPALRVEIRPAEEVTISGQIQSLTQTVLKGPIQITWSVPQKVQDEYRIVPDPNLNLRPDIDVTGPKDLVEQLDPREIRAFADVFAADIEKVGTKIQRRVQFVLPPGFSIPESTPPYEVTFELEPRAASTLSEP